MKINNSCIIWEGISLLDNKTSVAAIATGFKQTTNLKLGWNVVVVHIIRTDIKPSTSIKEKLDSAVCGSCPLSGNNGCYVNASFSTNQIYKSYKNNSYQYLNQNYLSYMKNYGKVLRLTAYGDITAVPIREVMPLINAAKTTIGYTHQWRNKIALPYRNYLMASVESVEDARLAQGMGWHTYRIKNEFDELMDSELHCSYQKNNFIQCQDCRKCDGKTNNIVVNLHGSSFKQQQIKKVLANSTV